MAMRVQRRGDVYRVVLSREGSGGAPSDGWAEVEVRPVETAPGQASLIRSVAVDEALEAYRETLPQHREAYRELAK